MSFIVTAVTAVEAAAAVTTVATVATAVAAVGTAMATVGTVINIADPGTTLGKDLTKVGAVMGVAGAGVGLADTAYNAATNMTDAEGDQALADFDKQVPDTSGATTAADTDSTVSDTNPDTSSDANSSGNSSATGGATAQNAIPDLSNYDYDPNANALTPNSQAQGLDAAQNAANAAPGQVAPNSSGLGNAIQPAVAPSADAMPSAGAPGGPPVNPAAASAPTSVTAPAVPGVGTGVAPTATLGQQPIASVTGAQNFANSVNNLTGSQMAAYGSAGQLAGVTPAPPPYAALGTPQSNLQNFWGNADGVPPGTTDDSVTCPTGVTSGAPAAGTQTAAPGVLDSIKNFINTPSGSSLAGHVVQGLVGDLGTMYQAHLQNNINEGNLALAQEKQANSNAQVGVGGIINTRRNSANTGS